jgi:nascent polypeptide-associated complex subunit alpha
MFPGGMNPKNMQRIMKQMGIKSEEIPVKKVVFELENKKIVINDAKVTAVEMSGQKTFTVIGEITEEKKETEIPESDIEMVVTATGKTKEQATQALKESNGDIAEAIEKLK